MKKQWKDTDLAKVFREMGTEKPSPEVYDHVWVRIQDQLQGRQKAAVIWRPWGHPVRWVALAGCLCLSIVGINYQQNSVEKDEVASYVLSVSNPTDNIGRGPEVVNVSSLMSEPPVSVNHSILLDPDDGTDGSEDMSGTAL